MTRPEPRPPRAPRGRARDIAPSGFFAFRTPLLPVDELIALGEGLRAAGAAEDELDAALAADRAAVRERMRALLARPEVREAIFVASPSLDDSLPAWLEQPDSERGQKVERTLTRYLARMAGRSTPFGLFAGCSIGTLGDETRIELGPRAGYERHTRLDMDYVCALTERLGHDPELRRVLVHRPNSSLYHTAGRLRYAEARIETSGGRSRSYHLVALDATPYLDATLERARDGARPHALAAALAEDDPEVSLEEAEGFINELIDNQVLVADLEPAVTGPEPIHGLVDALEELRSPAAAVLRDTRDAIDAIDRAGVGGDSARYRAIAARLEALPAPVELPRLFQVDMVKPAPGATLGAAVVDELARIVELLHRTSGGGDVESLRQFRERFNARYETREVPLADALDEESGIGFERSDAPGAEASPLLEGLAFGGPPGGDPSASWGAREHLLLGKLLDARRRGAHEIELVEEDWKLLERPAERRAPLPDAFAVMGAVLARSPEAVAAGDFRVYFHGAPGPSGAVLLGRFCHADPALEAHVRAHLRAEEALRPGVVHAEIVHLPEGRIGNVIARPVLREHEIVYLGRSGAPLEKQLPITDLIVTVEGNRVVLRSRRLGVEVAPRLTNAHNISHPRNLSLYKFLATLQRQGVGGAGWGWGTLDSAPFLPRVRTGRVILSFARWRATRKQLEPLGAGKGSARFRAAQALRHELGLPRWVAVTDGDNELPIDLDNVLSVETFAALIKDRNDCVLDEIPSHEDAGVTRGPEGRFVHELVVPFVRSTPAPARPPARAPASLARSFGPGSDWLYAKLYAGPATVDGVLRDVVAPVVAEATTSGAAQNWFFIRYGDPDWHIRLRFMGEPRALHGGVLASLRRAAEPLLADGRLWRMQLDTYEREVERYGGPEGMELAERIFAADSAACLEIVETLSGDEGADARWRLALRGTDMLLADLGLDVAARRDLMRRSRESFGREFGAGAMLDKQLGDKFRRLRGELDALLAAGADDDFLGPGLAAFVRRSERLAPVVDELRAAEAAGRLRAPIADLAGSYVHMHVNRLARSSARAQELVLYDFLGRLYESRLKRK